MSFTVISVLVGDSELSVFQGEFKIQNSKSEENGIGVMAGVDGSKLDAGYTERGSMPAQVPMHCEDGETGENDTRPRAQAVVVVEASGKVSGATPKSGAVLLVDREERVNALGSGTRARRSNADGRRMKFVMRRSKSEERKPQFAERKSAAEVEDSSGFVMRSSRAEEGKLKYMAKRSRYIDVNPTAAVRRSSMEKRGMPIDLSGSKAGDESAPVAVNDVVPTALQEEKEHKDDGAKAGDAATDMSTVFGPPLYTRRDTVLRAQPGAGSTEEAAVAQGPAGDSTVLMKRKAARAAALEKEEENKHDDKPLRRTSLYFTAMPTMGYQRVQANASDNIVVVGFKKLSNFSSKRLGVRAELGAEYALTSRVKVFGGVLYYQRRQTINYTERVTTGMEQSVSGDTLTLNPQFSYQEKSFEYELKNLGIQLGVNYVLWKKKFLHVAGTGIEFHKALNKLSDEQKMLGFSTNPSTYVFYNLYYRVQYPAEGRLKAIFQPTLNYSLFLNKDMNAPFYVKPYGLGLNLGVTYNF